MASAHGPERNHSMAAAMSTLPAPVPTASGSTYMPYNSAASGASGSRLGPRWVRPMTRPPRSATQVRSGRLRGQVLLASSGSAARSAGRRAAPEAPRPAKAVCQARTLRSAMAAGVLGPGVAERHGLGRGHAGPASPRVIPDTSSRALTRAWLPSDSQAALLQRPVQLEDQGGARAGARPTRRRPRAPGAGPSAAGRW